MYKRQVLVREAKAVGVKFYNHHPVVELARVGDRIAGALAVDISTCLLYTSSAS